MATNKIINQKYVYDPNIGKDIREMKATRSFYLSGSSAVTGAGGAIASTVVGTNQNIVITGFSAGITATNGGGLAMITPISLQEGSSSVCILNVQSSTAAGNICLNQSLITPYVSPLLFSLGTAVASGTRTLGIYASTNGTFQGSLWGRIEPILSKTEV